MTMPFLLAEHSNRDSALPLFVRCIGSHEQKRLERPLGYPAHQLFLCRGGRGTFIVEGGRGLTLTAGHALLIPADVPHAYSPDAESDEPWNLGFIAFDGGIAMAMLEQMGELALSVVAVPAFEQLWELLAGLWQCIGRNGEQASWEASKRLYDILLTLLEGQAPAVRRNAGASFSDGGGANSAGGERRANADNGASAAGGVRTGSVYPFPQANAALHAAVKLMHDHYDERLLIANVARAVGYSAQHFHRLFAANYGMTPQQYILQLRMRRAVQLFGEQPGQSVESVARQLGMETSYFIRMFKRAYGTTPKQYLKR